MQRIFLASLFFVGLVVISAQSQTGGDKGKDKKPAGKGLDMRVRSHRFGPATFPAPRERTPQTFRVCTSIQPKNPTALRSSSAQAADTAGMPWITRAYKSPIG